jgi:two-component system, cell cycle sensor histidine kinase and response regulator CckA
MVSPPTGVPGDLFQALVEHSSDAIALLDERGIVRFESRSAGRVLGYAPEERLNRSAFELVHAGDAAAVAAAFARSVAEPGTPVTLEFRMRHKDGSWRHIEAVTVNRLAEAAVGGFVVNYRDLSKEREAEDRLRRSEARYRSLIHNAAYGLYRTTLDGRILEANPAFARMLGHDSIEDAKTLNMADVYVSPPDRAALVAECRQASGQTLSSDVAWRRKDGTPITVRITARMVELEGEEGIVFEGIAEDITANRAFEEQLRQSQKMEAVGQLARGIAHDFNNVLAAILGCSDLMQLRLKPEDPLYLDASEIGKAAERGASLTRQLLAFSRRQALEPQALDVHAVLRGFDAMLQRIAGAITLRLHTPGAAPIVRVEPGQIEQVVMNLVLNARDATPAEGRIDVYADTVELGERNPRRNPGLAAGRYARIAVHDTGTGIDRDLQRNVFEPFFTTKDPATGKGLGLSIVYGIANEAGGTVTLRSPPGQGTTFEVLLPLVEGGG